MCVKLLLWWNIGCLSCLLENKMFLLRQEYNFIRDRQFHSKEAFLETCLPLTVMSRFSLWTEILLFQKTKLQRIYFIPPKLKIRVVNLCPYPFLFPLYLALYHFLAVNIGCPHFSYKVLSYIHFRIKINVFSCSLINGHSFCYPVFLPTHRERILF